MIAKLALFLLCKQKTQIHYIVNKTEKSRRSIKLRALPSILILYVKGQRKLSPNINYCTSRFDHKHILNYISLS